METKFFRLVILLFVSFIMSNVSYGQNFSKLPQSTDSTYGYSAYNPLKLKSSDPVENIGSTKKFLNGLKTANNQDLTILGRTGVADPNYKERPGGIAANLGEGGILDKYELISSVTKDTIVLYVDIYHKGKLMIPSGLKYVKP